MAVTGGPYPFDCGFESEVDSETKKVRFVDDNGRMVIQAREVVSTEANR